MFRVGPVWARFLLCGGLCFAYACVFASQVTIVMVLFMCITSVLVGMFSRKFRHALSVVCLCRSFVLDGVGIKSLLSMMDALTSVRVCFVCACSV